MLTTKTSQITVRMTDQEFTTLRILADRKSMRMSDVMRCGLAQQAQWAEIGMFGRFVRQFRKSRLTPVGHIG